MTNGDLIRTMPNDKLVKLIEMFGDGAIDYRGFCDICDGDHCAECVEMWLSSDVNDFNGLLGEHGKIFGGEQNGTKRAH